MKIPYYFTFWIEKVYFLDKNRKWSHNFLNFWTKIGSAEIYQFYDNDNKK